jgi:hypothetical protein
MGPQKNLQIMSTNYKLHDKAFIISSLRVIHQMFVALITKNHFQNKTLESPRVETWFFGLNAQCYEFMSRVGKLITLTSLDF